MKRKTNQKTTKHMLFLSSVLLVLVAYVSSGICETINDELIVNGNLFWGGNLGVFSASLGGRVGIGTVNPGGTLHINSAMDSVDIRLRSDTYHTQFTAFLLTEID
jgi:hypothetical protein